METLGRTSFWIKGTRIDAIVAKDDLAEELIIGADALAKGRARLDFGKSTLHWFGEDWGIYNTDDHGRSPRSRPHNGRPRTQTTRRGTTVKRVAVPERSAGARTPRGQITNAAITARQQGSPAHGFKEENEGWPRTRNRNHAKRRRNQPRGMLRAQMMRPLPTVTDQRPIKEEDDRPSASCRYPPQRNLRRRRHQSDSSDGEPPCKRGCIGAVACSCKH